LVFLVSFVFQDVGVGFDLLHAGAAYSASSPEVPERHRREMFIAAANPFCPNPRGAAPISSNIKKLTYN
jgi:hypothetical protein